MKSVFAVIAFLLVFSITYPQDNGTNDQAKPAIPAPVPAPAPEPEKITEPEQPKSSAAVDPNPVKKPLTEATPAPVPAPVPAPNPQAVNEEARLMAMVDANTKNPDAYTKLLKMFAANGKHKERLKVALKAIQNIGGSANLYLIVGDENKFLGDNQKALISYQFALRLMPSDPNIYNLIGLTLLRMAYYNQAEAAFKAAIFFGSGWNAFTRGMFYNNLAVANEAMHDLQSAYRNFQAAVRLYPAFKTAQDNATRVRSTLKSMGVNVE
jgi:tetratricopeptide (TPR) repeat protein